MAWDDDGRRRQDPWSEGGGGGSGSGPPDLDEYLRRFMDWARRRFGGRGGPGPDGSGRLDRRVWLAGLAVVALVWGVVGLYQVDQQQKAVVLRLGAFHSVVGPGLHWNPPIIDRVTKVNVTRINSISHRALMLTEDENIVDVNISVQYLVTDPEQFLLRVKDPVNSLQQSSESALRHVVGSTKMDQILTNSDATREQIAADVQDRIQSYMDTYQTGLRIEEVNIEEPQPPQAVKNAFDDVLRALEDETRFKNEAETYSKGVVPEARGAARRVVEEAMAYREQVVAQAEGEADRFVQLLEQYRKAPAVTRDRMYLDAVQSVLSRSTKIMVDVDEGNSLLFLPVDKLAGVAGAEALTRIEDGQPAVEQALGGVGRQVMDELENRGRQLLRRPREER